MNCGTCGSLRSHFCRSLGRSMCRRRKGDCSQAKQANNHQSHADHPQSRTDAMSNNFHKEILSQKETDSPVFHLSRSFVAACFSSIKTPYEHYTAKFEGLEAHLRDTLETFRRYFGYFALVLP
jgi:hypothetical protein